MKRFNYLGVLKHLGKPENIVTLFFVIFLGVVFFEIYFLTINYGDDDYDEYPEYFEEAIYEGSQVQEAHNGNLTSGRWQPVVGTRLKLFVYAAHYDSRLSPEVRVIGATRRRVSKVHCLVFPNERPNKYTRVSAKIKTLSGETGLPLTSVVVRCQLPPRSSVPWAVAVGSDNVQRATNVLRVNGPFPPLLINNNPSIAACVQPITLFYSQPIRLIEFIEMNTLVGINHFIFYNQSVTSEISCLLNHYARQDRVTVLPWNFDLWSRSEKLKNSAQSESMYAAYNDCVYRTINQFHYTTFLALDEFLVPTTFTTLQNFINSMETITSYSFSNGYFFTEWPDDKTNGHSIVTHYMMTAFKTRRTVVDYMPTPHGMYTYLCPPETVLEVGANFVLKLLPGEETIQMNDTKVISHLYLPCEGSPVKVNCSSVPSVVDLSALRYTRRLADAMITQWSIAMPICTLHEDEEGVSVTSQIVMKHHVPFLVLPT